MAGMKPISELKLKTIKEMWRNFSLRAIGQRVGMTAGGVRAAGIKAGLPHKGPWRGEMY